MTKATILLVDNDADFLKTTAEFLEREGYEVIQVIDPERARRRVQQGDIDLSVLDLRLVDDADDRDYSGLALAEELVPWTPVIIVTDYASVEAAREAFRPQLDGMPLAVDFVSKTEGKNAIVRAINLWHMMQPRPQLREVLIEVFEIPRLLDLPNQIQTLGPEEASRRLQRGFEDTASQLTHLREEESQRASRYHAWGLVMAIVGMTLVFASAILVLFGSSAPTSLPLIGSAVSEAVSILFFVREDAAHKRVSAYFAELNDSSHLGNLITIAESLTDSVDRENYKKRVLDKVLERWMGA